MAKIRTKSAKQKPLRKSVTPPAEFDQAASDAQIMSSNLTLHELFQQQTSAMLDRADLSEEQRQSILIGMSCPCCGGGAMSFTAKLKRAK